MDTIIRRPRGSHLPAAFYATAQALREVAQHFDAAWRRARRDARAAQDLANMSERDLADIGITRADVPRAFDRDWPQGM